MSTPVIAVKLTTPPTRNSMGGIYGAGTDGPHAREKFVDSTGNLNLAVTQLQQVLGIATGNQSAVTGLLALVNGNLSFGNISSAQPSGNLKTIILQGTTPATINTNFTLTHNLGKIPNGYVVLRRNVKSEFFGDPTTGSWNSTTIQIQCDTVSVNYTILVL